jgi:16S rRNA processing protein RimM
MSDDLLIIGEITGTHGVRGDISVFPLTDDVTRFQKLKECILTDKAGKIIREVNCTGVKFAKNRPILRLKEISDMDAAALLKGKNLCVTRQNAVALPENAYFICDIVGCVVFDVNNTRLGEITDVITTGANDVYVVKRNEKKDLLLPAIKAVVKSVDTGAKVIVVELPEGLLEIYN